MLELKKKMLRMFFTLELVIFTGMYFFGAQGLAHAWRLNKEVSAVDYEVAMLETENQGWRDRLLAWEQHPYYKEKEARVQLQMAKPQEQIYYIVPKELS